MSYSKEELEKIVKQSVVEAIILERQKSAPATAPVSTESHAEHILGCPSCFKDFVEKLGKTSEAKCADCGLPLGSMEFAKKLDSCPSCHGKDIKEIRK